MRTERSRARKLLQWGHALSSMECRNETWRGFVARLCFNGAMLFRAWNAESHRIRNHCNLGFNGAMLFRAWNVRPSQGWWTWHHRFNGAMLFRAWNAELHCTAALSIQASMGPCSFEHGMQKKRTGGDQLTRLQWGHALSSME